MEEEKLIIMVSIVSILILMTIPVMYCFSKEDITIKVCRKAKEKNGKQIEARTVPISGPVFIINQNAQRAARKRREREKRAASEVKFFVYSKNESFKCNAHQYCRLDVGNTYKVVVAGWKPNREIIKIKSIVK